MVCFANKQCTYLTVIQVIVCSINTLVVSHLHDMTQQHSMQSPPRSFPPTPPNIFMSPQLQLISLTLANALQILHNIQHELKPTVKPTVQ